MIASAIRTTAPPGLTLRRMSDDDLPFLAELYASTRRDEMALVAWSDAEKEAFLRSQFDFQHRYYQEYYRGCEFLIVERGAAAVGRLYVDRWPDQIRIVDIALLPRWRGQGFGTALLDGVLAEADASGLPVTIHVERNNPAQRLYARLGFRHVDSNGIYHLLRRDPGARTTSGGLE